MKCFSYEYSKRYTYIYTIQCSKLEYTRTSVSRSLSDEKQLLRQIDTIKRAKIALKDSHQHEVAIQEKKVRKKSSKIIFKSKVSIFC